MEPQDIGHQFVSQYYQLLHQDPSQLHRFYLESSKYCFASDDGNVTGTGQEGVYDAVESLNFSDCRVRVRNVDGQACVGNSVVVQVVGDISNRGQPMRPFVQTFVLSPAKNDAFFVSNDMFRYQDHVLIPDAEMHDEMFPREPATPTAVIAAAEPLTNGRVEDFYAKPAETHTHMNGSAVPVAEVPEAIESPEPVEAVPEPQPEPVQASSLPEPVKEPTPEPVPETKQEPSKFSWATVAGTNSGSAKKPPAAVVRAPEPIKPAPAAPSASPPTQAAGRPQRRANGSSNGTSSRAPSRPNGVIPDNQQIFVGGLTSSMSEEDIKAVFKGFGNAIDIKMTPKLFCFVSFDSPRIVENILAHAKTDTFYLGSHRLNVEEKKERAPNSRPQGGRQNGGPAGRGGRMSNNGFARNGAAAGSRSRDAAASQRR